MKTAVAALIVAIGIAGSAAAQPFKDGYDALTHSDYATAMRLLHHLAEQGNAVAQYNVGLMYYKGEGVPQNYAAAVSWFRKAADQEHAAAQYSLGHMYFEGRGIPQNSAVAIYWFRRAADSGDARAQTGLGFIYSNGQVVPQDDAAAVNWYRKAADQGDVAAQYYLGSMYFDGRGVQQNYVSAYMWFDLAAVRKHKIAAKSRAIVAAKMTPAQIADAQRLSREWKPGSTPVTTPTGVEGLAARSIEKPTDRRRTSILSGDGEKPLRPRPPSNEEPPRRPASIAQPVPAEAADPITRMRAYAASGASPQEAAAAAGFGQIPLP
jgi:TPR repeat protein